MAYHPDEEIIEKYADLLVNFALGEDEGIQKGDVVYYQVPEYAKPLYVALQTAILEAGGHPIGKYAPNNTEEINVSKNFYDHATEEQVTYFPEDYLRGLVDEIDHRIAILADTDKHALEDVDSSKIMAKSQAYKPFADWMQEKESKGEFSWTLALYGTEAMAKEVDISPEEYWGQIINACFLDTENPIKKWREVYDEINTFKDKLNALDIDTLHIEGEDIDLIITLGEKRRWRGGSGNNIPSFEIFTSPDWRGTEGWARFSEPLYRYGTLVEGIELEFEDGEVVAASAEKNEQVLLDMIETAGANKVGEFSLTDSRHSRITQFMAETLYDENVGGKYGNTHIALGRAYKDCINVDAADISDEDWEDLGVNDSAVHTDIISTTDRVVTATLEDGSKKVIYEDGKFQLD